MMKRKKEQAKKVQRSTALKFEVNEYFETLRQLKEKSPERFARSISGTTARALEIYEKAREREAA